jgi:hypothetical protein
MANPRLALVLAAGLVIGMLSSPTVAASAKVIGPGSAQNRSVAGLARTDRIFSNNEVTGSAGVLDDGTLLAVIEAVSTSPPTGAPTPGRTFSGTSTLTTIESTDLIRLIDNKETTSQSDTDRLNLGDSATDLFILNIAGMTALNGSVTTGGLMADHVLYNFNAAGGNATFQIRNSIIGALPAPSYSLTDAVGNGHRAIAAGGRGGPLNALSAATPSGRAFDSGSLFSDLAVILLGAGLAGAVMLGLWHAAATHAPPEF